ncbi:MAG: hypothetical protein D6683_12215, partial [Actinomyces sp.]
NRCWPVPVGGAERAAAARLARRDPQHRGDLAATAGVADPSVVAATARAVAAATDLAAAVVDHEEEALAALAHPGAPLVRLAELADDVADLDAVDAVADALAAAEAAGPAARGVPSPLPDEGPRAGS